MNLKQRFSIIFSSLFTLLLGLVLLLVFSLFSSYRKEEFHKRLEEKALTTIKLLVEVQEVDIQLLKIIDRNTLNELYHEKILVFNDSLELIYSSIDDAVVNWKPADLFYLKDHKTFYRQDGEYDLYGMYYDSNYKDYFALVSAEDKYGKRKLDYLKYLLVGAFVLGLVLVCTLSFYLSKRSLRPLDKVREKIQQITDKNLIKLPELERDDEINALSRSFNQMIDRIDNAYKRQKEFTANASHELRTPIARIAAQLENILRRKNLDADTQAAVASVSEDIYELSDVVTSLLLLSSLDRETARGAFEKIRLDEVVYKASELISKNFPGSKLQFEIQNNTSRELDIEVQADETLLLIAVSNLLKNAHTYSENNVVQCVLQQNESDISLKIVNTGETPAEAELSGLVQPFVRGSNTKGIPGSGLGLMIVKRILDYFNASLVYNIPRLRTNELIVTFKI